MVAIREEQDQGPASTVAFSTFTVATALVGDLICLVHANNFYAATNLSTPTGTAVTTWTLRHTFDGGTNGIHWKVWTGPCTTNGGTVIVNGTTADEERYAAVFVFNGGQYDMANSQAGTSSTSWVAPGLTPSVGFDNDQLLCFWCNSDALTVVNITPPATMTPYTERDVDGFDTYRGASELLVGYGATGTRTATSSVAKPYVGVSVLIKSSPLVGFKRLVVVQDIANDRASRW